MKSELIDCDERQRISFERQLAELKRREQMDIQEVRAARLIIVA